MEKCAALAVFVFIMVCTIFYAYWLTLMLIARAAFWLIYFRYKYRHFIIFIYFIVGLCVCVHLGLLFFFRSIRISPTLNSLKCNFICIYLSTTTPSVLFSLSLRFASCKARVCVTQNIKRWKKGRKTLFYVAKAKFFFGWTSLKTTNTTTIHITKTEFLFVLFFRLLSARHC